MSFFPTLARGGTVVLMAKFDALKFLELAQQHRATHAMLVPVQYQRIMDLPDFDRFDLQSFRMKFCTSAPFAAALKADILEALAGRPDGVLRHDRGRRQLRPATRTSSRTSCTPSASPRRATTSA